MEKQIFNAKKALELVDNDKELLKILMESFLSETFEASVLESKIDSRQPEEAASYVHHTKGAGRQLCAELLAEAGQNLEDVLRGKTQGNIRELTEKMVSEYDRAVFAIKNCLERI